MNFKTFTTGGKTFTAAEQAAAFEAYIQQDEYLSKHRGQYAERGAVFFPIVKRIDLSLTQDLFHAIGGRRHSGQIRLDITNFGNLLNHNWGVGQSIIQNRILTSPSSGRPGPPDLPDGDREHGVGSGAAHPRRSRRRPASATST